VNDGKASEMRIRAGRRSEETVEIIDGVKVGDQVVINPGNMTDGEKVSVKK
jgi:multidrug efflux pump subunit AcrA (membrane-fusion protein)